MQHQHTAPTHRRATRVQHNEQRRQGQTGGVGTGQKTHRMTIVIQKLGAEIKRELTCLPLNEEGAEHGCREHIPSPHARPLRMA